MATDLERFRDHCRRMAESTPATRIKANWAGGSAESVMPVGSLSDEDRAMWRLLAGEADAFLRGEGEVVSEVEPDDAIPLF